MCWRSRDLEMKFKMIQCRTAQFSTRIKFTIYRVQSNISSTFFMRSDEEKIDFSSLITAFFISLSLIFLILYVDFLFFHSNITQHNNSLLKLFTFVVFLLLLPSQIKYNMSFHQTAWLTVKSATPLKVKKAQYIILSENEIIVKNAVVAVNLLDWFKQSINNMMFSWIKYFFVMNSNLTDKIIKVNKGVTCFKIDDCVISHTVSMNERSNKLSERVF